MATAAETGPVETVVHAAPHPWDVSRPEIYAEDRWQPIFAEMRATAPINKITGSAFGDYWNVTTMKPIQHVEALPDIYSSDTSRGGITIFGGLENMPEELRRQTPSFISMDRPEHTAQRRTVAPAFTPAEMERLSGDIRRRTGDILDSLPRGETFDWVDTVSIELTTQMLAILFDFPWEERRKLTLWSDWAADADTVGNVKRAYERREHMRDMTARFMELWQERLDKPEAPDLLSRMIHSDAMSNMDRYTFIGNMTLLIIGGNDTTRNSMSAYAYGLEQFPGERAKLEQNPDLIPTAVQEIIRWQTPLAHMRRTATEDTELFGHPIAEGDKMILWYISANRDENVFERPDDIIVDRENARRQISFGYGIHRCVGARLAELQLRILLEEMAERRLRVNVIGEPERVAACFVHGYRSMKAELSAY
ncbi:cytochrome P450 [uncultured Parasphingopyxis sp.]|uniref:cytochrome P450 n=1 Tax=uncultured Parasphingopyxis sp. TaxID=1547918 RepID=UPI0026287B10|nr:cytochrome P450 [uncultured Parasphingopyxis sp.]